MWSSVVLWFSSSLSRVLCFCINSVYWIKQLQRKVIKRRDQFSWQFHINLLGDRWQMEIEKSRGDPPFFQGFSYFAPNSSSQGAEDRSLRGPPMDGQWPPWQIKQNQQCFVFNIYMGFPCFCRYTWWIVYWYQYSLCWKFLCLMDRNLSYKDIRYKEIKK